MKRSLIQPIAQLAKRLRLVGPLRTCTGLAMGLAAVALFSVASSSLFADGERTPASGASSRRVMRQQPEPVTEVPMAAEPAPGSGRPLCPEAEEMRKGLKPIGDVSCDIVPKQDEKEGAVGLPPDCAAELLNALRPEELSADLPRGWAESTFSWQASQLATHPLYFENAPLERYGQTICPILEPAISGAKFFGTIPLMPYKMALQRPRDTIYLLGYYRPGSCAPFVREKIPLQLNAATAEGLVIAGLILLIP